ncbi:hypothetical protein GGR22_001332 [Flavobacterium gossypii]|uniref:Uncharacterized protein n=2 Tax=Flavobacterium TaxID=237 RepID=A0A495MMD4_9FLAO|nr:hypothetical protein [Flavobacterium gossypii]RKS26232.1 hypothetical protein CLV94_1289 [Flavobacterium endophyticum]
MFFQLLNTISIPKVLKQKNPVKDMTEFLCY